MPILFDLDGTLVDPRKGILASLRYALEKLGRVPPSDTELESVIGPPLHDSLASLLGSSDEEEVRACVALCLADGWSHAETALALGLPLGTVKSHVARGRARLLKALGGPDDA